jgi:Tfp pilus assembly protein PilX
MNTKGFTLLLSLLVISIILVIGLGVSGIIIKEIKLSGLGRESQIASYAAETGYECVTYWDIKQRAFDSPSYNIDCGAPDGASAINGIMDISSTTSFLVNLDNGSCARVTVYKNRPRTRVVSQGYNVDCDVSVPRKVMREWRY